MKDNKKLRDIKLSILSSCILLPVGAIYLYKTVKNNIDLPDLLDLIFALSMLFLGLSSIRDLIKNAK